MSDNNEASEVRQADYLDDNPEIREALLNGASAAQWVNDHEVRFGYGSTQVSGKVGESHARILERAANSLALYRTLKGDLPWPEDPDAIERQRIIDLVSQENLTPEHVAARLQEMGFRQRRRGGQS